MLNTNFGRVFKRSFMTIILRSESDPARPVTGTRRDGRPGRDTPRSSFARARWRHARCCCARLEGGRARSTGPAHPVRTGVRPWARRRPVRPGPAGRAPVIGGPKAAHGRPFSNRPVPPNGSRVTGCRRRRPGASTRRQRWRRGKEKLRPRLRVTIICRVSLRRRT